MRDVLFECMNECVFGEQKGRTRKEKAVYLVFMCASTKRVHSHKGCTSARTRTHTQLIRAELHSELCCVCSCVRTHKGPHLYACSRARACAPYLD